MYIDVVFSPLELASRSSIEDKTVVIIDVLRATTTLAYALWGYDNNEDTPAGFFNVIHAETVEEAFEKIKAFDRENTFLAGEHSCLKPIGFDFGNSPSEYTVERTKDKTAIFATTNGTKAIKLARSARFLTTASFVNASAATNAIFRQSNDIIIMCAGRMSKTTMEDSACAGLIVDLLIKKHIEKEYSYELSDSAIIAMTFFESCKRNLFKMLKLSEAGKNLVDVNLEKDLYDCSRIDAIDIATEYNNGFISVYNPK